MALNEITLVVKFEASFPNDVARAKAAETLASNVHDWLVEPGPQAWGWGGGGIKSVDALDEDGAAL